MASTRIAATLLPNRKTVHKIFGLPMLLFADSSLNIKVQSIEVVYLESVDVFTWDEAPMAPGYALEVLDRILRDIMQKIYHLVEKSECFDLLRKLEFIQFY